MSDYTDLSNVFRNLLHNHDEQTEFDRDESFITSVITILDQDNSMLRIHINPGIMSCCEYANVLSKEGNVPGNPTIEVHFLSLEEPCLLAGARVPGSECVQNLITGHSNLVDFVCAILDREDVSRLHSSVVQLATFRERLLLNNVPMCRIVLDEGAVMPTKAHGSDVGYDLTVIKEHRRVSDNTSIYDTGVHVAPPPGYYVQVVPRSSISKSGYMLSNSIGIIDPSYTGSLKIALTRIDASLPPLLLPFRCGQMIIAPFVHFRTSVSSSLDATSRADGGFGSTGV